MIESEDKENQLDPKRPLIRGKGNITGCLTAVHIYKYYTKDLDKESKYYVDYRTFKDICNDFNKMLSSKIIDDGYFFKVPYRLGQIRIRKRKIIFNNLRHDYDLYKKSDGKYKNHLLNEHSDNYYVRFFWTKYRDTIVKNKTPYSFIPTRANKRALAAKIKELGMEQVNKYFQ